MGWESWLKVVECTGFLLAYALTHCLPPPCPGSRTLPVSPAPALGAFPFCGSLVSFPNDLSTSHKVLAPVLQGSCCVAMSNTRHLWASFLTCKMGRSGLRRGIGDTKMISQESQTSNSAILHPQRNFCNLHSQGNCYI